MRKILLGFTAALALGACSNEQAAQPAPGYSSPASSQTAAACGQQARRLMNSPELGVQGGGRGRDIQQTRRMEAQTLAQEAAQAADQGDERTCRQKLDAAQTSLQ